jgi:hypothetical protein
MKTPEFQDYLGEYTAQGIGPLLYALILDIVRRIVQHYPSQIYSPNQVWDEDAISGLCHDFIMDKLLAAGWLEHHFLTQETRKGLEWVLKRDFRHFLISRKTRSEYSNLFGRVKRILNENSSFTTNANDKSLQPGFWGLTGWENKSIAQDRDEVLQAMFAVELPPLVRYRADSKKYSHILGNAHLTQFLKDTFRKLDKYVGLSLLMDGLRYRLNLLEAEYISLDEPIGAQHDPDHLNFGDLVSDSPGIFMETNAREIAMDVFERLSDRQRHILATFSLSAKPTLVEIGKQVHASKSTVKNEIDEIKKSIATFDIAPEEIEEVFSFLLETCRRSLETVDDTAE